jgi:hypothetical protein
MNNSLVYPESKNRHNHFQKYTSKLLYSSGGGELMALFRTLRGICQAFTGAVVQVHLPSQFIDSGANLKEETVK